MKDSMYNLRIKMLSNTNLLMLINKGREKELFKNLKDSLDILDIIEYMFDLVENNTDFFSIEEILDIKKMITNNVDEFLEVRRLELDNVKDVEFDNIKNKINNTSVLIEKMILEKYDVKKYFEEINFGTEEFFNYVDLSKREGKTKLYAKEEDGILKDFYISVDKNTTVLNRLEELKCYIKAFYLYKSLGKKINLDFDLSEEIDLIKEDYLQYTGLIIKEKSKTLKKI